MVPVIWAFFSADVNAGTARAARIAIIAITTSNSISVNADQNFFICIFIVGFFAAVVLRVFAGRGGSPEPLWRLRSIAATTFESQRVLLLFWGFWFGLVVWFVLRGLV